MSAYTPGPWFVARVEDRWGVFERSADEPTRLLVAWVEPSRLGFTTPIDAADAKLIAAAPDLLAACEASYIIHRRVECPTDTTCGDDGLGGVECTCRTFDPVRAAIAKARGK